MKRILMMEDDLELASHWREAFERRGYYVVHEPTVDGAIAALGESAFDLVVSDMLIRDAEQQIGKKGGFTLLTHISLNMRTKPKVIAVSGASASLNVLKHAAVLKADRTFTKPVDVEDLVVAAIQLLEAGAGG